MEGLSESQEGRYTVRLLLRSHLSETTFEIELKRPEGFTFAAGQSVRLFAGSEGRDYSMTSGPSSETLSFLVRRIEGGAVSPTLGSAPIGASFNLTGPHGVFVLGESSRPRVWAATGVGVAPFISMVRAGATGFILLHGVRRGSDLFHENELRSAAARYVPCVSAEPQGACYPGRVTGWAREHLAPGAYDFWLCGNRRMIRDFLLLVDERFPGSRVYTEVFFKEFLTPALPGDGAKRDKAGNFMILGRVDDVLNVSAHRIGTMEAESALVEHPSVAEAAVVGRSHDLKGQAIVAFVSLKNGQSPGGSMVEDLLRDIAEGRALGDVTTLADPAVVAALREEYEEKYGG